MCFMVSKAGNIIGPQEGLEQVIGTEEVLLSIS